jgi:DNA-binding LytR/AlgR family response regulator
MIASLPAWLSMSEPAPLARTPTPAPAPAPEQITDPVDEPTPAAGPADTPAATPIPAVAAVTATPPENPLLPSAVRGGVLRATADLQYVHLHSPEGMTTVPGPMHRVIGLLGDQGLEVRRGEWIADRHVKQVKAVRGRWVVLLKDGQQIAVSRRRLIEVKERWGLTRYA